MKKLIITGLIMLACKAGYLQMSIVDSLKLRIATSKDDSTKVGSYIELCYPYLFNNPDTAIVLATQALQLAQKLEFKKGEAGAYGVLWVAFFVKSEFVKALEYSYKSLHLYEELKEEKAICWAHVGLCNIYREQGNVKLALEHVFTAKEMLERLNMTTGSYAINIHGNLAQIYEQDNQLDSALLHAQIALDTAKSINRRDSYIAAILETTGDVHRKKGNHLSALYFYREALPLFVINNVIKDQITTCNGICESFLSLGQLDSALLYAQKAYQVRQPGNFLRGSQQTADLTARIYKMKGLSDSTVKYLELSNELKNEVYSQEKERQIQDFTAAELLRKQQQEEARAKYERQIRTSIVIAGFIAVFLLAGILWRNNRQKQKANIRIEQAYHNLKATQQQLIQSEKMASLGELTAGIAHEIQNPLNFVNNFSDVSNELLDEMKTELEKGNKDAGLAIAADVKQNLEKILYHGKRADAIVKGMLQHSRTGSGQKELTDINAMADEYLRLAYHGFRAKDNTFNAKCETSLDKNAGKINVIPQDIGRVLVNLIGNAFYAVNEKNASASSAGHQYEPTVTVTTRQFLGKVEVKVTDNGNGIPQKVLDKIFQPFFTTKPTGQGTGLGLSLSYDIITKGHGGELRAETKEGEGSSFIIILPANGI